jgi:hypothetical protein
MGKTKFLGNFQNFQKTLPVNLKYAAPKANTSNNTTRIITIWELWEGLGAFSTLAGDI